MYRIDFVLPWVDGSDPAWRERKNAVAGVPSGDDRTERYRDWGFLRYWFRGAERFAPWAGKIFFICDQEPPEWLRKDHPKLVVVRHEDYLPEAYRPAFSANPIELNIHRIPEISERFVYFNDDCFLLSPVPEDFFFRKGLPRDAALLNPVPTVDLRGRGKNARIFTLPLNDAEYLNRDYDFRACVRKHPLKWYNLKYKSGLVRNLMLSVWPRFVGLDNLHLPQPYLKKSFEDAWKQDGDILDATSRRHIRDDADVNHWLIRYRQLAEGNFSPRTPKGKVFDLDRNPEEAARTIRNQSVPMVCLNDGALDDAAFEKAREQILSAFREIQPDPSSFEADAGGRA